MIKSQQAIKLVCFDLDNTLLDIEGHSNLWDFLHEKFGVLQQAEKFKKAFFSGKISHQEWVDGVVGLWNEKGISRTQLLENCAVVKKLQNADSTLKGLRQKGYKLAVVSGSLDFAMDANFPPGLFDHAVIAKSVFSKDGCIVKVHSVCNEDKLSRVKEIAEKEGLKLSEIAFVGDGWNDIEAMREVGLGILINSRKEYLEKAIGFTPVVIDGKDLSGILAHL